MNYISLGKTGLKVSAEWRQPQHDDGESEEDTFDRFINNGQFPDRK